MKDGDFLDRENPGERYCSEFWDLGVESEGDASLDLGLFFFLLGVVGSVLSSRSWEGGASRSLDNLLPAME